MQPSQFGGPPHGPVRPGHPPPTARPAMGPGQPLALVPSQAMAMHSTMLVNQLAGSVATGLCYYAQLRADQAADRLARTDGRNHAPVRLQRYLNELRPG